MNEDTNITPAGYEYKYSIPPEKDFECYSMITCVHPFHGTRQFFVHMDEFQNTLMSLIRPYWVNGFSFHIQEMKGF